jgi:hypothetical protein
MSKIPFIHDIPLHTLWVLPITTTAAYLLPSIMQKIFPSTSLPDQWPLSILRFRLARVHYEVFPEVFPHYYRAVHVDVKDNLPLVIFFMTLFVLKESNYFLRNDFSFIFPVTFTACVFLTLVRHLASLILKNIAQQFSSRRSIQLAQRIDRLANKIAPSALI